MASSHGDEENKERMMSSESDSESSTCGYDPNSGEWMIANKYKKKANGDFKTRGAKMNESLKERPKNEDGKDKRSDKNELQRKMCATYSQAVDCNDKWFKCDICLDIFHLDCTNVTGDHYRIGQNTTVCNFFET